MHATEALIEADRLMTVCNSCRYCEGLCAVFPAMEMRRAFGDGDLHYLANLCHNCGACYIDCQFSPPHEFNVNVPKVLEQVRAESYSAYAWPPFCSGLFNRNGLVISVATAIAIAGFLLGFVIWHEPRVLFDSHIGPGAFYKLMPHGVMAGLFGAAFLYAILALLLSVQNFWRDIGEATPKDDLAAPLWQATKDAGSLRYLDGGGSGCYNGDERMVDHRRLFHHFTFYGFWACFAATVLATAYHYLLGREAPYPWYDLPVLLGIFGGIGLVIGPLGLLHAKFTRDAAMQENGRLGMDAAFLAMLLLTSLSGLALLILRDTPAIGIILALHLGIVFSFFLTMPYGKFVHGIYRFAALMRYAQERRTQKS
jgi:citrate/tricarballylate utilization protein